MSAAQTVIVGMSGGVDSSVSALLLKQQGYRVIGMFMKNWDEKDEQGVCRASREYEDVVRVCDQLEIPYYSVNFAHEYWENVFAPCLDDFREGHTPNPDVLCNREIKFKALLGKAIELGADFLATGHYCRIASHADGSCQLLKGADANKDQSYFLYTIQEQVLHKVKFPVGHLQKSEVRAIARQHGLATSEKKDSTGLCYIGERDFKQFLGQYITTKAGDFEDLEGNVLGQHDGVAFYTIGQRKGLGIGGAGDAWFVVHKDIPRNVVTLAQGTTHPALYCDELTAMDLSWISIPKSFPLICRAKIRYRQPDQECTITHIDKDGYAHVRFSIPQRAVTPQQSIVFYHGDKCLGGGIIQSAGPSYYVQQRPLPANVSP